MNVDKETEEEKREMEELTEKFQPLLTYLKLEAQAAVHDGEKCLASLQERY